MPKIECGAGGHAGTVTARGRGLRSAVGLLGLALAGCAAKTPLGIGVVPAGGAVILGRVVEPDGVPIPGTVISLIGNGVQDIRGRRPRAETGPDGHFRLILPPSAAGNGTGVTLRAELAGEAATKHLTAAAAHRPVTITLAATSITGTLVGPDGRPLPSVPITCLGYPQAAMRPGPTNMTVSQTIRSTDFSGHFTFVNLSPHSGYHLEIGGGAYGKIEVPLVDFRVPYRQRISRFITLRPGEEQKLGRIVVPRADGVVAGRVLDEHGQPLKDWIKLMNVEIQGDHTSQGALIGPDSRFRFPNVVREPLTLSLNEGQAGENYHRPNGASSLLRRIRITPNQENLRLVVPPKMAWDHRP